MKKVVGALSAVIGLLVLTAGLYLYKKKTTRLPIGHPAPAFELPALDGPTIRLEALRGRVALVNLWATWCPPCVKEMPSLERLHRMLKADGLVVLGVSADADEADVRAFLTRQPLTFAILRDPDGAMADRYYATGYPETYLIDKQGILRARFDGAVEWDAPPIVAQIRALLAG